MNAPCFATSDQVNDVGVAEFEAVRTVCFAAMTRVHLKA